MAAHTYGPRIARGGNGQLLAVVAASVMASFLAPQAAHGFECSYYEGLKVCIDPPSGSFSVYDPRDGSEITGVCGSGAKWSRSWNDAFVHALYYRLCGSRLKGY
jgi:hypothetical protein